MKQSAADKIIAAAQSLVNENGYKGARIFQKKAPQMMTVYSQREKMSDNCQLSVVREWRSYVILETEIFFCR